jgi:WD40 repeat protein
MAQLNPLSQPVILEHGEMDLSMSFSPDGTLLVVASEGSRMGNRQLAIVWNTAEWVEQALCKGEGRYERSDHLSFHPDGRSFCFASRLWDAATGKVIRQMGEACWLSFSPDGKRLVGLATDEAEDDEDEEDDPIESGWDGLLLNSETGETLHRLIKENDDREIIGLEFVQGGERVAATSYTYDYSDRVYLWETSSGTKLPTFDHVDVVGDSGFEVRLKIAPSGRYIITDQGEVQLWELKETPYFQWCHRYTCKGHAHGVWDACFSTDEALLVTMGAEALPHEGDDTMSFSVRLWDVNSGQERSVFMITGKCFGFGISPDGRLLATMSADTESYFKNEADAYVLTLWDIASGQIRTQQMTKSKRTNLLYHYPKNLAFSPDGSLLAVSHLKHVEVWNVLSILEN